MGFNLHRLTGCSDSSNSRSAGLNHANSQYSADSIFIAPISWSVSSAVMITPMSAVPFSAGACERR